MGGDRPSESHRSLTEETDMYAPRNKSRRVTVAVGASLTATLTLAACSGGGGAGEAPLGGTGEGGDGGTLVVPVNRSPWLPAYKALVAQYEEETGTDVELREFPYEEMRTQQINDIQNGTQTFDIFQLDEPYMPEFFKNEWLQPLTEIDSGFALDEEVNSYGDFAYWDAENQVSDSSGDLMVAPLNGNVHLLMYRKDLYEELGLEVPETWEDAIANGEAALDAGSVEYGYSMRTQPVSSGAAITYDFLPLLYSHDASWFVEEGTDWTPNVDTPEAIEAARTLRKLAELGPAETSTFGQAEAIAAMQAGETLQTHIVAAAAAQIESEADSNVAGDVGYAVLPAGPSGEPGAASGTWALGIPPGLDEERAQRALDYIEWIESKDVQLEFAKQGGIPTRSDALESDDFTGPEKEYFSAVAETMPHVGPHVRYWFSPEMLEVTEPILASIAAGSVSPEDGMGTMQEELTKVMQDTGLPMGG